jgi:hypothetical protein
MLVTQPEHSLPFSVNFGSGQNHLAHVLLLGGHHSSDGCARLVIKTFFEQLDAPDRDQPLGQLYFVSAPLVDVELRLHVGPERDQPLGQLYFVSAPLVDVELRLHVEPERDQPLGQL